MSARFDAPHVAVIGCGAWGRNQLRCYHHLAEAQLAAIGDADPRVLAQLERDYPSVPATPDPRDIFDSPTIDAVVIATPTSTHAELAKGALLSGKHVLVEKPLALSSEDARDLIACADAMDRVLMVGHLLLYHPVVERLGELLDEGELGNLLYMYTQRVNLGTVRSDENCMWSLAPHDIAVGLQLVGQSPTAVSAQGASWLQPGVPDVVFLTISFEGGALLHIHCSWLDPHKRRSMTLVGDLRMAVFDDMEPVEKLKIFDKGVESATDSYADFFTLRQGAIHVPHLPAGEPLRREAQHFLGCIKDEVTPRSDGRNGLRVVEVLEAAQHSLESEGAPVTLEEIFA